MFIKKIFPEKNGPIRFSDELYYILICVVETLKILIYNFVLKYTKYKKISREKNHGQGLSYIRKG